MSSPGEVPIPPHEWREEPWQQSVRGGTVEDRTLRAVQVAVPPRVASLELSVPGDLIALGEHAVRAVAALDATPGERLRPLATLLLRAESIASSKIEHEEATVEDFARALHGVKANSSATAMAAAAGAIEHLVSGPVDAEAVRAAHRRLMEHDRWEGPTAGRWRTVQNWIGGSDHSPRGALYVPPPPNLVPDLMDDLIALARRTDLPVLAQAAIVHAQFESIHPFTDGNGRIGRALAAAVIRQRGVARHVVVPVASALAARREHYFSTLDAYRAGDAGPMIRALSVSASIAAEESLETADRLAQLPERWLAAAGNPRAGSAARLVLSKLAQTPIFTVDDLETRFAMPTATAYRVIERLVGAGVLRPLTARVRDQVWGATDVLAELEDLGVRIAARARALG